jgi:hypothetical protein
MKVRSRLADVGLRQREIVRSVSKQKIVWRIRGRDRIDDRVGRTHRIAGVAARIVERFYNLR